MDHEMPRAHGGAMFLPWHRAFLLRFENALREVSGKHITVPYWDWIDPASTRAVFADDFMGGDGNPSARYAVTTGPFRKGQWRLNVQPIGAEFGPSATPYLTRRFGSFPVEATLPTRADVTWLMGRPSYDVKPFDAGSDPNVSFRNAMEGFWRAAGPARVTTGSASMVCGPDGVMTTVSGEGMHNRVHGFVGGLIGVSTKGPTFGTMLLPTSPNDPVFFLHHANIDRLWAQWQETHGVNSYVPRACRGGLVERSCHGNTVTDPMRPFAETPASVAAIATLGYRYDTTRRDVAYRCDL
jgi:tyrosinase